MSSAVDSADEASPRTPAQTRPLDEARRGAWLEGPDVVTALRVYGGDVELALPPAMTFTLGASRRCDLALPGRDLSALHLAFVRAGTRLLVHDQHSTNGVYLGGRRVETADLYPGDLLTAAPVTFLALNDEMRAQRPGIADIVGTGATPAPDELLVEAVTGADHLLLTGETGCDLDRLARAIHAVSRRRGRALVELTELPVDRGGQRELLRRAARSTLLVRLDLMKAPLDATFASMALSPEHHLRVIAVAPTQSAARRQLSREGTARLRHIWIRPLRMRADVPALLDRLLVERGATFRLADLTPQNRDALGGYDWRDNFLGLRLAADRLTAIGRVSGWQAMSWQERSAAVGMPKTTLFEWFTGLGLTSPLVAAGATGAAGAAAPPAARTARRA